MPDKITTIRVHQSTLERLQKRGDLTQTVEQVILSLLDQKLAGEAK